MKRLALGLLLVLVLPTTAVLANHPPTSDAGVDVAWVNDMNNETYWETLWNAECTQYFDHSGFIPAQYDAAVIKSGSTQVHVYSDLTNTGDFTAIGPPNPNATHPNRRFEPPFSWVMKCTFNQSTTTTTTTTIPDDTTTTTLPDEETTTTTIPEEETTTTTTPNETTTTTVPGETTTTLSDRVTEWTASAVCSNITVDFGEGIVQVNVWMQGGLPGVDDVTEIEVDPFLKPGTKTASPKGEFTLVPVTEAGWVASPDEITVFTEECTPVPTTTPDTPPSSERLPFTGINSTALLVGAVLSVLAGIGFLWRSRKALP